MTSDQANTIIGLLTTIQDTLSLGVHFFIAAVLVWLSLHQFNRFFGK